MESLALFLVVFLTNMIAVIVGVRIGVRRGVGWAAQYHGWLLLTHAPDAYAKVLDGMAADIEKDMAEGTNAD